MKSSTVKKFNWIAFGMIPITIILIGAFICFILIRDISRPDVEYDAVTPQTQSGGLHRITEVVEGEVAYVIYSIDENYYYVFDDDNLIAFQGPSVEAIDTEVMDYYSGIVESYWEGEGTVVDFSGTDDFKEFLSEVEGTTYYNLEPDAEVITANFSKVTVYDLSDYLGFERKDKFGTVLASVFGGSAIVFGIVTVLAVELLVALILKLTVFRMKKAQ